MAVRQYRLFGQEQRNIDPDIAEALCISLAQRLHELRRLRKIGPRCPHVMSWMEGTPQATLRGDTFVIHSGGWAYRRTAKKVLQRAIRIVRTHITDLTYDDASEMVREAMLDAVEAWREDVASRQRIQIRQKQHTRNGFVATRA